MAPAPERRPQFNIPFQDSESSPEGRDHAEWEKASTVKPDETQQQQAEHARSAVANEKESDDTEPENFDKIEITEEDCQGELGFSFPEWKKWTILTIIFLVQLSMNFNTSLYSNGLGGISKEFHVSEQAARCGAMIFLVLYAFGCELWAPWSEELGRWPILQLSLTLVNIWQLPVALAPNFGAIMAGRALGGLSSAGGSVTLGMIGEFHGAQRFMLILTSYQPICGTQTRNNTQWLMWSSRLCSVPCSDPS